MTKPKHRPRVYLAGPYSRGGPKENVKDAMLWAQTLIRKGYAPLCPHLTYFIDKVYPWPWETWLEVDEAWVRVAEAVFRMPGESPGSDRECELARSLGIPLCYSMGELTAALPVREG